MVAQERDGGHVCGHGASPYDFGVMVLYGARAAAHDEGPERGECELRAGETKSFERPLSSEVKTMATPTGEMRSGIQNLNLFRAIRTHEMCPLTACRTRNPRDLNMALAMTT
jgi:hypothetical protein